MDTALAAALATLLASAPNLVIAIWTIRSQDSRIDQLLKNQQWLVEQLMALHPPQDQHQQPPPAAPAEQVIDRASTPTSSPAPL